MNNKENMDIFISSILEIHDKKTGEQIKIHSLDIQKIVHKYSNTKKPIYKLVLNGKVISRNNKLVVLYKCHQCPMNNFITLNIFMRKINKDASTGCYHCANVNMSKCAAQSIFMTGKYHASRDYKPIIKEKTTKNVIDVIEESNRLYEQQDDDFKNAYLRKHLDLSEFERIKDKIISINHGKITNLDDYTYVFNYRVYNQTLFNPMLVNVKKNIAEKIIYIKFRCEHCDGIFINRDLWIQKNKYKILCQTCNFTNKTFKIRSMKNIHGEKVTYQRQLEKKFIVFCNDNNIVIQNGDVVNYTWHGKELKYIIDFKLPQQKLWVELKDNHVWHKEQVKSGKFAAKVDAAKEWALELGFTYHVVFQKEYMNFIKSHLM